MKTIKLLIADDQVLFLKGLRSLIANFNNIELLGEARDGKELLHLIPIHQPDVVLVDYKMPVMDGVETTKKVRANHPELKVILLSMYHDESIINHVMKIGANGYLLKNEEPEVLERAIEAVVEKDFYFNDYVSKALLNGGQQVRKNLKADQLLQGAQLTKREVEVLQLICKEYTSSDIANELYISIRTVEGHRKNLLSKTGVRNTAGLVLFALKNEIFKLQPDF